ncbi:hypothetical protein U3516DRAFT_745181 [Neocallimastix sp. 'constans']
MLTNNIFLNVKINIKITKSENSTTAGNSSKTSKNTTKTAKSINAASTAMNDCPVEVEPSNIQTNTINKFNIQSFKNYKRKLLQMKYSKNLSNNCTKYNNEAKLQNKSELNEETKVLYFLEELNKFGITYSFTFRYVENDLKEDIIKLSTTIKKKQKTLKGIDIKEVYQHKDQINRVRNGKIPYNFNKETNFTEYCHSLNDYRGEKKNNNNKKSRNKNKNKRTLLSWKDNVNYEEQSNSVLNSDIII